ncbi:hypothetical protein Mapa_003156 [Marchantia paleacea]|nr:hypothetical protein Mapa_003156 [Marchantia paleacea]
MQTTKNLANRCSRFLLPFPAGAIGLYKPASNQSSPSSFQIRRPLLLPLLPRNYLPIVDIESPSLCSETSSSLSLDFSSALPRQHVTLSRRAPLHCSLRCCAAGH